MKFGWTVMVIVFALMASSETRAQDLREVFKRVNPSVIVIHTQQRLTARSALEATENLESRGSGLLISEDGKVLTA